MMLMILGPTILLFMRGTMSKEAQRLATLHLVQAYYYYLHGCQLEAEHLILRALTFSQPIGNLIAYTYN